MKAVIGKKQGNPRHKTIENGFDIDEYTTALKLGRAVLNKHLSSALFHKIEASLLWVASADAHPLNAFHQKLLNRE